MNKLKCQAIFARLQEQNPNPTTELKYTTSFELLIAVLLSAQSTDRKVNEVTRVLFAKANKPETMLTLGVEAIKEIIRPVNYYITKAKHIVKTCEILVAQYNSIVPKERAMLEKLPGVGRKTANVILNTAFKIPTMAVDTHIFRVANRTGLASGKTPLEVEHQLVKIIAKPYLLNAHHWLILHGRYVCTAKKPHCATCIIQDLCEFKHKHLSS
ncbi:MAG: endonuclease III [Legionellales bacterium RIFCSPHIGHO2_12_FULL_37_14]|nr:MAG: endonuclease III [Legionellales bacterium RIFCSPHIGHO2_12_FULL_37_14]